MSIEHAVHRLTGELADWYAVDAGHLRVGDRADLVVIDPQHLDESLDAYAESPVEQYDRLPRMVNRNDAAVTAVFVNGEHVFGEGLPGEALGKRRTGQFLRARI
jgi:N-acyl-D-aspartate/D-glutamate deacylase